MLTQQDPGIAMPKIQTSDGGNQQPPRILTGFSFEENDPEQQHTHASTTASEHADDGIEPNLAILTESELYALIRKSLASLRRYDWTPTGWQEVE